MKIKFLILTLCFMFSLSLPVAAAGKGYVIELPEEYIVSYGESKEDKVAEIFGMEDEKYKNYFSSNGMLFIAVKEDNSAQLRFSKYTNEFSAQLGNLSNLNDGEFKEIAEKLSKGREYKTLKSGEQTFIAITETLKDSGGEYTSIQYITVKNGYVYQLSCYNAGDSVSEEIENIFSTLKFSESNNFNWLYAMIIVACVILAGVIVIMIKGIVSDLKKPE
ncbi:MAG: hypothetical protein IJZ75_04840 [Clostridia bacterium]|nr:hypothetical protein [Clostridia bacterium]